MRMSEAEHQTAIEHRLEHLAYLEPLSSGGYAMVPRAELIGMLRRMNDMEREIMANGKVAISGRDERGIPSQSLDPEWRGMDSSIVFLPSQ